MKPSKVLLLCGVFLVSLIGTSLYLERLPREPAGFASVDAAAGKQDKPRLIELQNIAAESYLIVSSSGTVLADHRASREVPIASLTKIMTALLLAEHGVGQSILITPDAKAVAPKRSGIPAGMILALEAARTLILVESDNDVAEAAAASVGSRIDPQNPSPRDAFVHAMNEKARRIGMTHTHFENPTGLDAAGHYSSAEDLALLVNYISQKHPAFWDITADPPRRIVTESGAAFAVQTTNVLRNYPGLVAAKTGLTDEAEGALILRYRTLGYPEDLTIVILRSSDRFGDAERILLQVQAALKRI